MTTTTTTTTARRAPKAVRVETTKALNARESAALAKLVQAATKSISDALTADASVAVALNQGGTAKVYAGRALAALSTHPAVASTSNANKGEPALAKMATLIGKPAQSLETYWKGAKSLIAKDWAKRTGAPKAEEIALMNVPFLAESQRVSKAQANKGKGAKTPKAPVTKSTKVTFDSISGQLDALVDSTAKYSETLGFTEEQASTLAAKLDAVLDAIEKATATK